MVSRAAMRKRQAAVKKTGPPKKQPRPKARKGRKY